MFQLIRITPLLLLFIHFHGQATNYYVNDNALTGDVFTTAVGNNANSGTSPNTPKATLSNVLSTYSASLTSGDVIYVDAGMYLTSDANISLPASLNGISIIGAGSTLTFFDNNNTSTDANRWANITGSNITIQGIYLKGYNYGLSAASTLTISGATNITITDVQVNENSSGGGASAIVINGGSSVNFVGGGSKCNPIGPSVAGGGVNIEGNGNNVSFSNYSITGNTKALQGGSGMYISGDNTTFVTVTNSTISNNVNTSSEGGAGIYISGANLSLSGSCISGNSTNSGSGPKYGGGITLARGATVTAVNCSFSNNSVTNTGRGGAVSINTSFAGSGSAASASFTSCSFTNNTASSLGNHIYLRVGSSNPASVAIDECTFSASAQVLRQDNTGTVSIQNSGNPSLSGTGITVINTTPPVTSPASFCPSADITCFSLLPIELIQFEAKCSGEATEISWTTASERNNDYFILEKMSTDGSFQNIAKIDGSGQSQEAIHYSFRDASSAREQNYYRLKQVDFDGQSETFEVISSENCSESDKSSVHYDSNFGILTLFLNDRDKLQTIEIISMLGAQINLIESIHSSATTLKFQLEHALKSGNFIIRLQFTHSEERIKFVVF